MQLRHKEAATQRKALHWAQELFSLLKTQTNKEIQPQYIKSYLDTACNSFKQVSGTVIRFCFMKCWVPLFHRIEECFLQRACCESRRLPRVTEQPAAGGELLCYWTLDGGRKQKKHFMPPSKHQSLHKKNVSLRNTDDKTPGGLCREVVIAHKTKMCTNTHSGVGGVEGKELQLSSKEDLSKLMTLAKKYRQGQAIL